MVEFRGRYRPRNAVWYKDMDAGFLKATVRKKKEKPKPTQIQQGPTSEAGEFMLEGKQMLGKIVTNLNGEVSKQKEIKKKIYG